MTCNGRSANLRNCNGMDPINLFLGLWLGGQRTATTRTCGYLITGEKEREVGAFVGCDVWAVLSVVRPTCNLKSWRFWPAITWIYMWLCSIYTLDFIKNKNHACLPRKKWIKDKFQFTNQVILMKSLFFNVMYAVIVHFWGKNTYKVCWKNFYLSLWICINGWFKDGCWFI